MTERLTIRDILDFRHQKKISALATYDFHTARMIDDAGIDIILAGDSAGNMVYGFEDTLPVTMDMMLAHTCAVSKGSRRALVVGDMPFGSYQPSIKTAVKNAARFLSQAGAQAVKLEGGISQAETISRLVDCGIPVMGHIGLTPQSVNALGGYRIQGKGEKDAERLMNDALAVQKSGAFSVVLECITPSLAATITQELSIPTIGIGSGDQCDGQILVLHDLIGLSVSKIPNFAKPLANIREIITDSTKKFIERTQETSV